MSEEERGRDLALQAIQALPDADQLAALAWLVTAVARTPANPLPFMTAGSEASAPELAPAVLSLREPMTPQEGLVVHLLSEGLSVDEVAAHLSISPTTVRKHLRRIIATSSSPDGAWRVHPAPRPADASLTMLPVRLPDEQYRALKVWCAANKFSMATVIRGLVEKFLADQQKRSA